MTGEVTEYYAAVKMISRSISGFLNLSITDIWMHDSLSWAALCIVGCLGASLAFTYKMPVALPPSL